MKPTIRQLKLITGYSVKDWPGACGMICHRILDSEIVYGTFVKGVWSGITNYTPESLFWLDDEYLQMAHPRHCWIETIDGNILDATRWVFEGVKPYVYYGKNDYYKEYNCSDCRYFVGCDRIRAGLGACESYTEIMKG